MAPHGNAHNRAMRSTSEEEQGPEAESGAHGPRGIQSVEVGGQLLKVLAHTGRRMALKDLAREADMSPAKAHPYLVSFGKLGLIEQDGVSGHYGLGPLALQLGLISLQQVDPVQLANAELPALAQRLGHSGARAGPPSSGSKRGRPPCMWPCATAPPPRCGTRPRARCLQPTGHARTWPWPWPATVTPAPWTTPPLPPNWIACGKPGWAW